MTSKRPRLFEARWQDLPDPRDDDCPAGATCSVYLKENACRHIVKDHLAPGTEPWAEWLGAELVEQLVEVIRAKSITATGETALVGFAERLGKWCRAAMSRPLVLTYDSSQPPERCDTPTWQCVLPTGALLVIRRYRKQMCAWTCYFPDETLGVTNPAQRWCATVARLVQRYATPMSQSGGYRPPRPSEADDYRRRERERYRHVRFVAELTWGFRGEVGNRVWRYKHFHCSEWILEGAPSPPPPAPLVQKQPKKGKRRWRSDDQEVARE